MTAPVLTAEGRAVIFDRETGEKLIVSVPTAIENVENGHGRFVHGETGERLAAAAKAPAPAPEPAIALTEPDVLPLPEAERAPAPPAEGAAPKPDPLDHDGDGKKGGSKVRARTPADPERAAVIAELKAKGVKFFAGAPTDKLKSLLPG